jgi:hypothetical protein
MTGLSRAQVTRLVSRYVNNGVVQERSYRRNCFTSRYTAADIEPLAAVDQAHETLSGPATQKILYSEFHDYGDARYERLSSDFGGAYFAQAATSTPPSNCIKPLRPCPRTSKSTFSDDR